MSKKELFIKEIEEAFNNITDFTLSEDALTFFESLKASDEDANKPKFTDNGLVVIKFMREHKSDFNNLFKAKDCEEAGITAKTASGAFRKLVSDGYVEKLGKNPCVYSLTEKGLNEPLE